MRNGISIGALVALALLAAGCERDFMDLGLPETVSDTGYEGTWRRGSKVQSILAIVRHEDRYRFRYTKISEDDRLKVDCSWDGDCRELFDGEELGRYHFDTSFDEEAGRLRIECNGRIEKPTAADVHYVDELVVARKGLLLRSWTVEDRAKTYEFQKGPRRDFRKVSNYVLEPPEGWAPRDG